MPRFQILCATMNQSDFSKIKEMNIHSDVIFANQADRNFYDELEFEGHRAKMITTDTRGVGINRNLALLYADADICLFADDDMNYYDGLEEKIVGEFEAHPDADIIIFNIETTDPNRIPKIYNETKKCGRFARNPWGGPRIAFKLNSVRKANIWFTTLFGGGCKFPSGEDSMWITQAMGKGLTIYVSKEKIGLVDYSTSTWFDGRNERFYYGKGAFYEAVHKRTKMCWFLYFALRTRKKSLMKFLDRIRWMYHGAIGYRRDMSYEEYISKEKND